MRKKSSPNAIKYSVESGSLGQLLEVYLKWMAIQQYSVRTIQTRRKALGYFLVWCHERSVENPLEITPAIVERYQRYLYQYKKRDDQSLSFPTQRLRLIALRMYFRWLTRNHYLPYNPASELEIPKPPHRIPHQVLSVQEVETILSFPNLETVDGLRDRAILETLYSTGIRRQEITNLDLEDCNREQEL